MGLSASELEQFISESHVFLKSIWLLYQKITLTPRRLSLTEVTYSIQRPLLLFFCQTRVIGSKFLRHFLFFQSFAWLDIPQISPILPEPFQLLLKDELSFSEDQSAGTHSICL